MIGARNYHSMEDNKKMYEDITAAAECRGLDLGVAPKMQRAGKRNLEDGQPQMAPS